MYRGFDWHGPSQSSIESALVSLDLFAQSRTEEMNLPNIERLIYSGHSNGGQGAWWFLGHFPDRAIGAIPASGYVKIQLYAPYYMRLGHSLTDPSLRGLLESSIAQHDNDLYVPNMVNHFFSFSRLVFLS